LAGIVEGAALVGWRLTQLPRSQALEFLLVSPLRPFRTFLAEALVGLALLGLVTLSGLPVLLVLVADGRLQPIDVAPLLKTPLAWGVLTGLALTVWAYEPVWVRRVGERILGGLLVLYLLVGVLAGEHLRQWLAFLPDSWRTVCLEAFALVHTHNPFAALQCWLEHGPMAGWPRIAALEMLAWPVCLVLLLRGGSRLQRHFHEEHYQPVLDTGRRGRCPVGDHPLSWWAVRRVSKFSGRINLWLAGGFTLLYALYIVAGDAWPAWLGRMVFQMCDRAVGVAGLTTGLVVLAAVPAAFQYGLWSSSSQNRCRRLELLLLTELGPADYWHAAACAAWHRGRGYLLLALVLCGAEWAAGRSSLAQVAVVLACSLLLWSLYFTLGFRAFSRGLQAGGMGLLLTVGLPLAAWVLCRAGASEVAMLLPPGMLCTAARPASSWGWLAGPVLCAGLTLLVARKSLRHCDEELRRWYDANAGHKVLT
jgi:hypothetical protein